MCRECRLVEDFKSTIGRLRETGIQKQKEKEMPDKNEKEKRKSWSLVGFDFKLKERVKVLAAFNRTTVPSYVEEKLTPIVEAEERKMKEKLEKEGQAA